MITFWLLTIGEATNCKQSLVSSSGGRGTSNDITRLAGARRFDELEL